jgi:hypothetical protein
MEKRAIILIVLAGLMCCSISNATITNVVVASDGDGAIVCLASFDTVDSLSITGKQCWAPGHMLGDIYTTDAEDPTLKISNSIDNDTTNMPTWTDYHINVFMSSTFTITNAAVTSPNDWTVSVTQPVSTNGSYMGTIDYYAGTAVPLGDTLDFGYWLKFSGAAQYSYTQEMIPTPEPGTLGLVTISGLLLGGFALARRRRRA